MDFMRRLFLLVLLFGYYYVAMAQHNMIFSDRLKTLMVRVGDDLKASPVINLGEDEYVEISFDELSHDYRRMAYKVEHCEADWGLSDQLIESDF